MFWKCNWSNTFTKNLYTSISWSKNLCKCRILQEQHTNTYTITEKWLERKLQQQHTNPNTLTVSWRYSLCVHAWKFRVATWNEGSWGIFKSRWWLDRNDTITDTKNYTIIHHLQEMLVSVKKWMQSLMYPTKVSKLVRTSSQHFRIENVTIVTPS